MRFFVPGANSLQEAEKVYWGIREFVNAHVGPINDVRIQRIEFSHDGARFNLAVGDIHPQVREPVIAIFEVQIYYICTPNRGVLRGAPYLVGRHDDTSIELFEDVAIAASDVVSG